LRQTNFSSNIVHFLLYIKQYKNVYSDKLGTEAKYLETVNMITNAKYKESYNWILTEF
jgi:hypothetical protein